jgi:hypothetical protein
MNPARIRCLAVSRTKALLLAGMVFFIVGFAVWPGCAIAPLPSKRTPVGSRTSAQFKFDKSEHPTRAEVISRLGQPDDYFPHIRVACYKVNDVTRRKVFLCLFVIPINVEKSQAQEIAFIEFDEQDRVRRADLTTEYSRVELKKAAELWLSRKEKREPARGH